MAGASKLSFVGKEGYDNQNATCAAVKTTISSETTAALLQALLGQRGIGAAPAAADEVFYTSETDAQPLASGAPPWCQALVCEPPGCSVRASLVAVPDKC